jgi:NAD(P)H-flavin reductase
MIDEIPDVVTIRAEPVVGTPRPFRPAQVGMLGAFGVGEAAISISSSPSERAFHDFTVRRAGAITSALTRMTPGDQFWVRGPFGSSWSLDVAGDDVLIAAGGIGLAPLRSAIHHITEHRDHFGRVVLVVGARSASDLLYRRDYESWQTDAIEVVPTIDHAETGWSGRTGFVPDVVSELDLALDRLRVLICGPDIMMRLTADGLVGRGMDAERIELTLERNMQCGTGRCGHCQLGGLIVCRDGPVVGYPSVAAALGIGEY